MRRKIDFNILTQRLKMMNFAEDNTIHTITHNGVRFPEIPEYVVNGYGKYKLAGDLLDDLAVWQLFAWTTLNEKYKADKVYEENFYKCLYLNLTAKQQKLNFPEDFSSVINKMNSAYELFKAKRDAYRKSHKEQIKREQEEIKAKYGHAIVNGEEVELGNTMVENSRIFIGRGNCYYRGGWVKKVEPEDINLNSSEDIPCPIRGHHWGNVEVRNIMSIATYYVYVQLGEEEIKIPAPKLVPFSNKSQAKADRDAHKFDKALLLERNMPKIKREIKKMYMSDNIKDKQIGLCTYLVSEFGIRAGNESIRDNGVVGATTLLTKNVILLGNNTVQLKFLGKDSVEYNNKAKIDKDAYSALEQLMEDKEPNERLFDRINSGSINKFLQEINPRDLPDLTLKVFRTFFGTSLLAKEIQKHEDEWSEDMTDKQFSALYDECALAVTKKLNHKKTLSDEQVTKLNTSSKEKLARAKDRYKTVTERLELKLDKIADKKDILKANKPRGYLAQLKELNEEEREIREKLAEAEQAFKDSKREIKYKLENKDDALNTAKTNYSNPKIAYSLCKYCGKDPKVILSKALIEKFNTWVDFESIDENYWKDYPNVDE